MQEALESFCSEVEQECTDESMIASDAVVITEGRVVDGIIDTCRRQGCDMIVMAHPVRRVIDEPLFGATTRGGAAQKHQTGAAAGSARTINTFIFLGRVLWSGPRSGCF